MASAAFSMNPPDKANPSTRKHTGPRTPEGKARSAQNARKHGFSAVALNVLPAEQAEFDSYQNELLAEICPQAGLQADLFRQLVHAGWTLIRLERYELEILAEGNPFKSPEAQKTLDRLERYRASHRRAYSRALAEIRKLQTDAMLWATTHTSVQDERDMHFPLANPAAPRLNRQIEKTSDACEQNEAIRDFEALQNEAACQFDKTNSPRETAETANSRISGALVA